MLHIFLHTSLVLFGFFFISHGSFVANATAQHVTEDFFSNVANEERSVSKWSDPSLLKSNLTDVVANVKSVAVASMPQLLPSKKDAMPIKLPLPLGKSNTVAEDLPQGQKIDSAAIAPSDHGLDPFVKPMKIIRNMDKADEALSSSSPSSTSTSGLNHNNTSTEQGGGKATNITNHDESWDNIGKSQTSNKTPKKVEEIGEREAPTNVKDSPTNLLDDAEETSSTKTTKIQSKKADYYVKYDVVSGDTVETVAQLFHSDITSFINGFANYTDTDFTEGTKFFVPVRHHVLTGGQTIESVASIYKIPPIKLKQINDSFNGTLLPNHIALPVYDKTRKIIVHRTIPVKKLDSTTAKSSLSKAAVVIAPIKKPTTSHVTITTALGGIKFEVIEPIRRPETLAQLTQKVATVSVKSVEAVSASHTTKSSDIIKPLHGEAELFDDKGSSLFKRLAIRIFNNRGSMSVSSSDGLVVYSGGDIAKYKKVVVVKNKNYTFVYGNLEGTRVKAGDFVKQGQDIGSIGPDENIENSNLYFSIRGNDGVEIDPRKLFVNK